MFGHLFKNRMKVLLRNKVMIFWTLIFPIALATFFNLAFSNLNASEKFEAIDIAVIENEEFKSNTEFKSLIDNLTEEDIFNTKYTSLDEANKLLDNNEIIGYILVSDKIDIMVKQNGLKQTIVKSVVDQYYQINSSVYNIISKNNTIKENILDLIDNDYFNDVSNKNVDATIIYFYTLIGMTCLYSGFFGINAVNDIEANLSKKGARISIAPTHKFKVLSIYLLVTLVIQYIEMLILFGYLKFVLNVNFGNQTLLILLLMLIGSLTGIVLGALVGLISKKDENTKIGTLVTVTMLMSFLSGMMVIDIKYLIDNNLPILAKINPVTMITDALYSLYYYTDLNRFIFNVVNLIIFSLITFIISYSILRRKKYDSI